MFSGTTISYHHMNICSEDVSTSIFQLHIENFVRIIQLMAVLFFMFFGVTICMDVYYFFTKTDYLISNLDIIIFFFKQLVNLLGILTGVFCVTAVRLKSRGSSLKLTKIITIFSQIYVIYLVIEIINNYQMIEETFEKNTMKQVSVIYFTFCFFLFLIFFLKFLIGKSKQYNSIITQAILDNTKRMLEGIDGPLRIG